MFKDYCQERSWSTSSFLQLLEDVYRLNYPFSSLANKSPGYITRVSRPARYLVLRSTPLRSISVIVNDSLQLRSTNESWCMKQLARHRPRYVPTSRCCLYLRAYSPCSQLVTFEGAEGHTQNVTSVSFHPEGKWVVSGSEDGTIKIWDLR